LVQWKPLDGSANFEAKQQIAFGALRELLRVCSISPDHCLLDQSGEESSRFQRALRPRVR